MRATAGAGPHNRCHSGAAMGPAQADPFEIVKADIQESLAKAQHDFASWQRAKSARERAPLAREVEDECDSITWQVQGLNSLEFRLAASNLRLAAILVHDPDSRVQTLGRCPVSCC